VLFIVCAEDDALQPSALKILLVLPALLAMTLAAAAHAQRLSPLAPRPDWRDLDKYQESITRDDFRHLLEAVYAPHGAWKADISIGTASASIRTSAGAPPYVLRFAPSAGSARPAAHYWRQKAAIATRPGPKPLAGLRIAIDPGHIGGKWAKVEERWFRIGKSAPITEGDMTLHIAKLLAARLKALGAQVWLTRSKASPVTSLRPQRLGKEAAASLADKGQPATPAALKSEADRLFYRTGEIRQRADVVNELIKPDVVLCLHFNAEAWGDPDRPTLTDKNHMHLLVNGSYDAKELSYDDVRFTMLRKLLSRAYREELAISESVAAAMSRATSLPAYQYDSTASALKVGSSPFVWARNLAANRLFDCPVIFLEPYVMNSQAVFDRIQAGDYEGKQAVGGKMQKSIFREYVDGVAQGLVDYYSPHR
jgi:N-acetylmuramoyl-L-alanine amidase